MSPHERLGVSASASVQEVDLAFAERLAGADQSRHVELGEAWRQARAVALARQEVTELARAEVEQEQSRPRSARRPRSAEGKPAWLVELGDAFAAQVKQNVPELGSASEGDSASARFSAQPRPEARAARPRALTKREAHELLGLASSAAPAAVLRAARRLAQTGSGAQAQAAFRVLNPREALTLLCPEGHSFELADLAGDSWEMRCPCCEAPVEVISGALCTGHNVHDGGEAVSGRQRERRFLRKSATRAFYVDVNEVNLRFRPPAGASEITRLRFDVRKEIAFQIRVRDRFSVLYDRRERERRYQPYLLVNHSTGEWFDLSIMHRASALRKRDELRRLDAVQRRRQSEGR